MQLDFHQQLNNYAGAKDIDAFAAKILGKEESFIVKDSDTAIKVTTVLKKFLDDNKANILPTDLSNLKKVEELAQAYNVFMSGLVHGHFTTKLEKTLAESITEAQKHPLDNFMPRDKTNQKNNLFSIVFEYCTIPEMVQLTKLGRGDLPEIMNALPGIIEKTIKNMEAEDVIEFAKDVERFKYDIEFNVKSARRHELQEVLTTFFDHASTDSQKILFGTISHKYDFNYIISILPKKITKLNFGTCQYFKHKHLCRILDRLERLESLEIGNCIKLVNKSVELIAESRNTQYLEELSLRDALNLTDEAIEKIAFAENLVNLKKLTLTNCKGVSDDGIISLANGINKNLQTLDFSGCALLTDRALSALATSSNLKQLEKLVINDCVNLTNEGIKALTESNLLPSLMDIEFNDQCENIDLEKAKQMIETMRSRKNTH